MTAENWENETITYVFLELMKKKMSRANGKKKKKKKKKTVCSFWHCFDAFRRSHLKVFCEKSSLKNFL